MLFLGKHESKSWRDFAENSLKSGATPLQVPGFVRPGLEPAFHYYMGTFLLAHDLLASGADWINAGIAGEEGGLFSNSFMASYLKRNGGRMVIPEVIFADPAPYIHFAGTPVLVNSRAAFMEECTRGLPAIHRPVRVMDIGCGHGKTLNELLLKLRTAGRIGAVGEILLIDPSENMLKMAVENTSAEFPEAQIKTAKTRIEAWSDHLEGHYDLALASLAYHHMPFETKLFHLKRLREHIDSFIIFELNANNDSPDLYSPDLALSVYQSYGAMIDFVFAFDAPPAIALASIDKFLMSEAVFFFTEPRGTRTDYHMLRSQWHEVFSEGLGPGFHCLADSVCHGDHNLELFTMIYSRM